MLVPSIPSTEQRVLCDLVQATKKFFFFLILTIQVHTRKKINCDFNKLLLILVTVFSGNAHGLI